MTMTLTGNQKAVLAEHKAADQAVLDVADAEEQAALGSLLGREIIAVRHDAASSGVYELTLDDGRVVRFDLVWAWRSVAAYYIFGPHGMPYIGMSVATEQ